MDNLKTSVPMNTIVLPWSLTYEEINTVPFKYIYIF